MRRNDRFARYYDRMLEPLEQAGLRRLRRDLLTGIAGRTLELGVGTGANLDHYKACDCWAIEPDAAMLERSRARLATNPVELKLLGAVAEELPFESNQFDVVVSTLVLCSVESPARVLREVRRVLKEPGRLLFIEHVRGGRFRGALQDLCCPVWKRLGGRCHPNRDTVSFLESAGFVLSDVTEFDPSRWLPLPARLAVQLALPFVSGRAHLAG